MEDKISFEDAIKCAKAFGGRVRSYSETYGHSVTIFSIHEIPVLYSLYHYLMLEIGDKSIEIDWNSVLTTEYYRNITPVEYNVA